MPRMKGLEWGHNGQNQQTPSVLILVYYYEPVPSRPYHATNITIQLPLTIVGCDAESSKVLMRQWGEIITRLPWPYPVPFKPEIKDYPQPKSSPEYVPGYSVVVNLHPGMTGRDIAVAFRDDWNYHYSDKPVSLGSNDPCQEEEYRSILFHPTLMVSAVEINAVPSDFAPANNQWVPMNTDPNQTRGPEVTFAGRFTVRSQRMPIT